jgi:hypothetical protein
VGVLRRAAGAPTRCLVHDHRGIRSATVCAALPDWWWWSQTSSYELISLLPVLLLASSSGVIGCPRTAASALQASQWRRKAAMQWRFTHSPGGAQAKDTC